MKTNRPVLVLVYLVHHQLELLLGDILSNFVQRGFKVMNVNRVVLVNIANLAKSTREKTFVSELGSLKLLLLLNLENGFESLDVLFSEGVAFGRSLPKLFQFFKRDSMLQDEFANGQKLCNVEKPISVFVQLREFQLEVFQQRYKFCFSNETIAEFIQPVENSFDACRLMPLLHLE